MKKSITLLFVLIQSVLLGQTVSFNGSLINTSKTNSSKAKYSKIIETTKELDIYEIDALAIFNHSNKKNSKGKTSFQLKLGNSHLWKLELTEHNLFSENFRRVTQTNKGKEISYVVPKLKTYRGYNTNNDQKVVITLGPNWIYGMITLENNEQYFIEPLQIYDSNVNPNQFVVYRPKKSIDNNYSCGQNEISIIDSDEKRAISKSLSNVVCAEVAIAYDELTKNKYGGNRQAENILTSRFNSVSAFFLDNFEIDKKIIEFYEAGRNEIIHENIVIPCNNITFPDCGNNSILERFKNWGENNGFTSNPDVATFFTAKDDVINFIGYSYIGGICLNTSYNWVDDTAGQFDFNKVNLWIHEYGHTWNGTHTDGFASSSEMMNSMISFSNPMTVNNFTYGRIIAHKNSRPCLNDGSCPGKKVLNINDYLLTEIEVFPNPTNGILNINSKQQLKKIQVYNHLGQKILETNQTQINTNNLTSGIYLLKIYSFNGEVGVKKFIKE